MEGSPDSVMQIPLNPAMRVTNNLGIGRSSRNNKVILVESDKNIVVYGINKKEYSTDGFLALPTSVIGQYSC